MKKYLGILSFLLALPITAISVGASAQDIDAKTQAVYDDADRTLRKLLENPTIEMAFDQARQSLLRTNIDLTFANTFNSLPSLQMLRPKMMAIMEARVELGIEKGLITMTKIRPETQVPLEKEILEVFRTTLRAAGRSEKEVEQSELFVVLGDLNAYTFAGRILKKDAYVLQSDLIKELTYEIMVPGPNGVFIPEKHINKAELGVVLGHESGHDISNHVPMSMDAMIIMNQMMSYYGYSKDKKAAVDDDDLSKFSEKLAHRMYNPELGWSPNAKENTDVDPVTSTVRIVSKDINTIYQQNEVAMRKEFSVVIDTMINVVLQNGEIPPRILKGLVALKNPNTAPGSMDLNYLDEIFESVFALMEREVETSADMYDLEIFGRLIAAGIMTRFGGSQRSVSPVLVEAYLTELASAVDNQLESTRELYARASSENINFLFSSPNVNHPLAGARTWNLMKYGNTMDVLGIQNRVLRLVVNQAALEDIQRSTALNVALLDQKIEELTALVKKTKSTELKALLKIFTKQDAMMKKIRDESGVEAKTLAAQTLRLVSTLGFNGTLKDNLPLTDVLDYQLLRKIRNLLTVKGLEELEAATTDPAEKKVFEQKIQYYKERFNDGDDLLNSVKAKIKNPALLSKVDGILDPNLDVDSARQLRRVIKAEAGLHDNFLEARTYVPEGKEMQDIRESNIGKDILPKEEYEKRQAELNQIVEDDGGYPHLHDRVPVMALQGSLVPSVLNHCDLLLKQAAQKKPLN